MTTESWWDYYYDVDADAANETKELCDFKDFPYAHWILPTLYSIFFVIGLVGNMMVIIVVSRRTSRRADIFILNLAISDLTFVLTLPFWASAEAQKRRWIFGTLLCKTSGFTMAVTRCASSYLIAIMSVDRYVAVMRGTKVHPLRRRTCSIGACCVIWIVSFLIGCPSLLTRQINDSTLACYDADTTSLYLGFRIAVVFVTFAFPFSVVVFCYCRMARYLWNHFGRQLNKWKPRSRHSWLRIVTCVIGAYCFSWLPFNALNTLWLMGKLGIDLPCSARKAVLQALSLTTALAFANSCASPLIYALLDVGFRRRAQLALPRLFLTCRSLLSTSSSTMPTTIASLESTSTYTENR